jgi:hypothetical protein
VEGFGQTVTTTTRQASIREEIHCIVPHISEDSQVPFVGGGYCLRLSFYQDLNAGKNHKPGRLATLCQRRSVGGHGPAEKFKQQGAWAVEGAVVDGSAFFE